MEYKRDLRGSMTLLGLGIVMTVGCVGRSMTTLPAMPLSKTAPAWLIVSPPVSIIAVGGTQLLSLTSNSYGGTPVTTFDSVMYIYSSISDSTIIGLASTGVMTGRSASPATVRVNVFAFQGNGVVGDQVLAQVTPTVMPGLALSIQPVAPDSAKLAASTVKTILPVLRNATTGLSLANPPMRYLVRGADSAKVEVYEQSISISGNGGQDIFVVRAGNNSSSNGAFLQPNQIEALKGEGSVWIYALASVYGTILQDSVLYTLTYPYTVTIPTVKANLAVVSIYANQTVTLARGATVTFQNGVAATDPLTMAYTFDNPAAATAASPASTTGGAAGNVTLLTGGQTSRRQFLTPGTYRWTTTTAGGPAPWPGQNVTGSVLIK